VTDGFLALFERVPDPRRRRALVGVEVPERAPVERDGVGVGQDEVDADVLPETVGEDERARDTAREQVEAPRAAGEVVEGRTPAWWGRRGR